MQAWLKLVQHHNRVRRMATLFLKAYQSHLQQSILVQWHEVYQQKIIRRSTLIQCSNYYDRKVQRGAIVQWKEYHEDHRQLQRANDHAVQHQMHKHWNLWVQYIRQRRVHVMQQQVALRYNLKKAIQHWLHVTLQRRTDKLQDVEAIKVRHFSLLHHSFSNLGKNVERKKNKEQRLVLSEEWNEHRLLRTAFHAYTTWFSQRKDRHKVLQTWEHLHVTKKVKECIMKWRIFTAHRTVWHSVLQKASRHHELSWSSTILHHWYVWTQRHREKRIAKEKRLILLVQALQRLDY